MAVAARPADAVESTSSWRPLDRLALAACWGAGLLLCVIAAAIVTYMGYKGLQFLQPHLLWERPVSDSDQSRSGGFLDPLIGTVALTSLGTLIALPLGVATAVWLTEFGRPQTLARAVESGVEVIAGTPDIVLAIFGLVLFQQSLFGFLSFTAEGNAVFGRSFLTAGCMMALVALPFVVGGTREALQTIPRHVREASYALGKTKAATIRRVLLPASRPGIVTGTVLGMGRIVGDTAIVVILLGATLQLQRVDGPPVIGDLRGTGSTLTSYVYNNSPAGEGNAPEKAYAAAFVLLIVVIALNLVAGRIGRARSAWQS
jgi:phosphate transport system permease protein